MQIKKKKKSCYRETSTRIRADLSEKSSKQEWIEICKTLKEKQNTN